jgi:serine/threonine protein kinase
MLTQKRILRELKVLMHLRNHPNIINLRDVSFPTSYHDFQDVYLITDLMETDLRQVIRGKQYLSDRHVMYISK